MQDRRLRSFESTERPQDFGAHFRVLAHQIELFPVQAPRFVQYAVRNGDLPQIVQQAAEADPLECLFVHAHPSRDTDRPVRDSMQVAFRVLVARLDRTGE